MWWSAADLNRSPRQCECRALPDELAPRVKVGTLVRYETPFHSFTVRCRLLLSVLSRAYDVLRTEKSRLVESGRVELPYRPCHGRVIAVIPRPLARIDYNVNRLHILEAENIELLRAHPGFLF